MGWPNKNRVRGKKRSAFIGEDSGIAQRPRPQRRSIEDCIALAKKHEEETGEAAVLDSDFAADVEEIINNRKPWNPPAWD